jgi:hypothetical protein
MPPQSAYDRVDADIFLALLATQAEGESMKDGEGRTWPQIRYRRLAGLLGFGGVAALIGALFIPWEGLRFVVAEAGVAALIAGILAGLVEPHFRQEFARDAFLAAFRYVLPNEFKEEVEKIIRFEFIAERQVWTVRVDRIEGDDEVVLVTSSFDKVIKNRTKAPHKKGGYYTIHELSFSKGCSQILDCRIEYDKRVEDEFVVTNPDATELIAKTNELEIQPGHTARICGRATQFRRSDDFVFETFATPAINPEIEVTVPEGFDHRIEFGTSGERTRIAYSNRYILSGVYFPGQYCFVRWWPKKEGIAPKRDLPVLPETAAADPAQSVSA